MNNSFLNNIIDQIEQDELESKRLSHQKFRDNWLNLVENKNSKLVDTIEYTDYNNTVLTICPEPITFLKDFDDFSDDKDACIKLFKSKIEKFNKLKVPKINKFWFNTTKSGVNLRPGYLDNEPGSPLSVMMGDENVHGVLVGRTGSGKSVYLNNLIFNMLCEYAPWELDMYLVDMKKVELSRYLNKYKTPHIKAVAATSEIRYVVSVLEYLTNMMMARQNFFSALGIQKISDFRNKYNIVLPRIILIVDEFQQLFKEASSQEAGLIEDYLVSMAKLGRATGFHLLFGSQEMTATLSPSTLANFKIRMALPCDKDVSSTIIGNSAAGDLEVGNVIINTENRKEETNKIFKVPFIDDKEMKGKENYFYYFLKEITDLSNMVKYNKVNKFYSEDKKRDILELEKVIEYIQGVKEEQLDKNSRYSDILILGDAVVYKDRVYDLESTYLEKGKNKNLLCATSDIDDIVYIQKLLATNFKYDDSILHMYYSFNPIVRNKYDIHTDLGGSVEYTENMDKLDELLIEYNLRQVIKESLLKCDRNAQTFLLSYLYGQEELCGVTLKGPIEYVKNNKILGCIHKGSTSAVKMAIEKLKEDSEDLYNVLIKHYLPYIESGGDISKSFRKIYVWLSGVDGVETLSSSEFMRIYKNALDVNMFFMFFITSVDEIKPFFNTSEYIFVSGNNEKIYDKCEVRYTKKSEDCFVIDFRIKSLNTERSFKKYKVKFGESIAPYLDFDSIFVGGDIYGR